MLVYEPFTNILQNLLEKPTIVFEIILITTQNRKLVITGLDFLIEGLVGLHYISQFNMGNIGKNGIFWTKTGLEMFFFYFFLTVNNRTKICKK